MMANPPNREVDPPGEPVSTTNQVLMTGAAMVQDRGPVKNICAHLNAFHVYASDVNRRVEADHFCSMVNDDIRQCIIFDGNGPQARLIGVEYMISPKLYATLSDEEKKLWHTHVFEVKSGLLIMPTPPTTVVPDVVWEAAETREMEQVITLYGKTFHFWQVDRGDPLPLGLPQLMISYTSESQVDLAKTLEGRDERYQVDHRHKREIRRDIPEPDLDPLADQAWKDHQ